jgi:uncharacterized lipoprotein YmbA
MNRAWLALPLLLAGCLASPKESFYTLSAPARAATGSPAASPDNSLAIAVGPVVVPESVDRTPMVVRTTANRVDIDDFHRWAEPLKTAIPRVLAENLSRELGTARVTASRVATTAVDYRVAVEIQRFDSSFTEGATLDALWTITSSKSGAAPRTGRTTITVPASSPDHAGIAAAHSQAVAKLAVDVAAALR